MADIVDVAQSVIRAEVDESYKYLLARRTEDGYWEFIGGKRESDEPSLMSSLVVSSVGESLLIGTASST